MSTRKALHFVFKIANRKATIDFYRDVLGMEVLRHEEFEKGCEAACNGPYNGRWSKTMIGYGPEDNHFVIELTYNYEIKKYKLGNDFLALSINSADVISNAEKHSYAYEKVNEDEYVLSAPDGYQFKIHPKKASKDPLTTLSLASSNINKSIEYWHGLLGMEIYNQTDRSVTLGYSKDQCAVQFIQSSISIDRAEAYGRVAFACPSNELKDIEKLMNDNLQTILTPYISLDTPGKTTVQVVILADPDGHEICFVGDEGFRELSQVDPEGDNLLNKAMEDDKSDEWFAKKAAKKVGKD